MKKRQALLLGISLFFFTIAAEAQTATITFASDTTWAVSDSAGAFLGFAQNVCLSVSAPSNCPAGATIYGFGGGWSANLSSIPSATWIWAPGITGATTPAFPAEYVFSKAFNLPGIPTTGLLSVAVDDFAEVLVNNMSVGTTGSTTNISLASQAQSALKVFDLSTFLVTGSNVISVRAANGPFGCGAGPYSCNPTGVVFGGSLQFLADFVEVAIDIKPGSFPNGVNPRNEGVIPVAILTTDFLDATTVEETTVFFGASGTEAAPVQVALEDVDGDWDTDMILHFNTQDTGIACGNLSAILIGQTLDGLVIAGSDSIKTPGCKKK